MHTITQSHQLGPVTCQAVNLSRSKQKGSPPSPVVLVISLLDDGWDALRFNSWLTSSRPYSAARSKGVSCRLFLMVGSVSSCSSTETTSECPYWAAQWSAVSFSWFCGRIKGVSEWQQRSKGSHGNLLQPSGFFIATGSFNSTRFFLLWNVPDAMVMLGFNLTRYWFVSRGSSQEQCWWSLGPRLALDQW